MAYSLKMVKLDYLTVKSQMGGYITFPIVIAIFGFMGSSITVLSITSAWLVALFATNIFTVQEKNELERLYASLSLDLKSIIAGRYVFVFVSYLFALILSMILGTGILLLQGNPVAFQDIPIAICVSLLVFSLIVGVQMPIYFRLGYSKGKAWSLLPFVLVMVIMILPSFMKAFSTAISAMMEHQTVLSIVCVLVSCIVLFVSYRSSMVCYKKRR